MLSSPPRRSGLGEAPVIGIENQGAKWKVEELRHTRWRTYPSSSISRAPRRGRSVSRVVSKTWGVAARATKARPRNRLDRPAGRRGRSPASFPPRGPVRCRGNGRCRVARWRLTTEPSLLMLTVTRVPGSNRRSFAIAPVTRSAKLLPHLLIFVSTRTSLFRPGTQHRVYPMQIRRLDALSANGWLP